MKTTLSSLGIMTHYLLVILMAIVPLVLDSQSTTTAMSTIVHTPTNNLEESLEFYKKLNYEVISDSSPTLVTDGKVIIEINPDRYARPGVKMYKGSWENEVEKLEKYTVVHSIDKGYLLNDLNGCWIYLMEEEAPFDYHFPEAAFGMTGNFYGINMEASDMHKSHDIWSSLGFKIQMGELDKGFVAMDNADGFPLALMRPQTCPHLFFSPSMTFFNGKGNLKVIENIHKAGVPITEEITHFNKEGIVDNIIIRDPGGFGFFIFSD